MNADAVMSLELPDGRRLVLDRPRIMGILNVTPDSFSDGGQWLDEHKAVEHGLSMIRRGASVIDVGAESTRPGSQRVPPEQQISLAAPVVRQLSRRIADEGLDAAVSIDTTRSEVAKAAIENGATIINDISAGRDDPAILPLAATMRVPIVLMHMLGEPATMQNAPQYQDVVAEVESFLLQRAAEAMDQGVPRRQIVIDPGIGFGKTVEHNLLLLNSLGRFTALGLPVLLGASRKRFLSAICTRPGTQPPQPSELIGATCAATALAVAAGVKLIRVHDVAENRQAADTAFAAVGARAARR